MDDRRGRRRHRGVVGAGGCFRYMNRMDVNNVFTFSGGFVEWIDQILRRT